MAHPPDPGRRMFELRDEALTVELGGHRAEFVHWGYYDTRPWRNYWHVHSFFEICFAYGGRGSFHIGGKRVAITPGTVFVARPGDVHEIVASEDDPLGIYFWAFTLVRERDSTGVPRPVGSGSAAIENRENYALLTDFAAPDGCRVSTDAGHIPRVLELLGTEAASQRAGRRESLTALARLLVLGTARAVTDTPRPARNTAATARSDLRVHTVVRTMERYLQDNYDRPVAVRDVAAQVHLSPRHAGRVFKQVTGSAIHTYLARLRLQVAGQRLLHQHNSIKQVALACGYPDVRHFTTQFRRHWGTSPAQFRRRNGTVWVDSTSDDGNVHQSPVGSPVGSRPHLTRAVSIPLG